MKPRHAVALAFVGWYLMVPMINSKPVESDTPPAGAKASKSKCGQCTYITFDSHVDPKAPLSKWMMLYYSDSVQGCQTFLDKFKSKAKSYESLHAGDDPKRIHEVEQMDETISANARCVAADDPQLKGNEKIRQVQLMPPEERARLFERMERDLKADNGK